MQAEQQPEETCGGLKRKRTAWILLSARIESVHNIEHAEVMMRSQAALAKEISKEDGVLYMALDVGRARWKVALHAGGADVRTKWVQAGDFDKLEERIEEAGEQFGLADGFVVVSCYEAGRDGFWIHRRLDQEGLINVVVDPGSVRTRKNGPRAKTDRTDAERLARELYRYVDGDREALGVVHVPDPEDEDTRRMFRERQRLLKEKTAHRNRIQNILETQGLKEPPDLMSTQFIDWLDEVETPEGRELGESLRGELKRTRERLQLVELHLEQLREQRDRYLSGDGDEDKIELVKRLTMIRGIGVVTAWGLVVEMFGWRQFQNRRQLGAYVGLDGRRDDSGDREMDYGITGKGNARMRKLAIQLAYNWLHWQPESHLAEWARENFPDGDGTVTHCGVVALARKLLNRLRIFAHGGEPPWGAKVQSPAV